MKGRIIFVFVITYFLLSVFFPFLMMLEGNYYLQLNFNGILILNFIFIFIGAFLLRPKIEIENLEKGLLLLTIIVFINLLIHGIYKEEWIHFSYILSIALLAIVLKNIEYPKNFLALNLYIPIIFALSILSHLLLAIINGYGKLGYTNECFINPGHFSSFLMIFSPIFFSVSYFKKIENKIDYIFKITCWLICILIFFIVVFNNTRAGWIGAILISSLYHWIWQLRKDKEKRISISMKVNTILRIGFLFLLFTISAYFLKKDSSDGRFLIWKLSVKIIKDNPLTGVGFNRFEAIYNLYQSDYFKTHSDSKAAWLADNVLVAYNDFLQLIVELGILALLPIFYFLFNTMKHVSFIFKKNLEDISIKDMSFTALSIVVFLQLFFSYPLRITEITNAIFINFLYLSIPEE